MKKTLVLIALSMVCNFVFALKLREIETLNEIAAPRIVTGTVLDETGVGIPNVTITVEGSKPKRAAMTSPDGSTAYR